MNTPIKLLIAEDELNLSYVLQKELGRQGCVVTIAHNGDDAIRYARQEEFHVALLDLMMPGANGIQVLRALSEQEPTPEVIIMTGHATVNTALEAMKLGAYDYLTKPCSLAELTEVVRKAYEKNRLKRDNLVLQSLVKHSGGHEMFPRAGQHGIVTQSDAVRAVLSQIELIAPNHAPVLISGEPGTGKKLVAQAIHNASPRRTKPFVTMNCAAMSEDTIEAELFGYEAGALASARSRKLGLFELAHQGTLFLEEIGCLPAVAQARLQRVLETMSFYRIGGTRKIEVDVRLVVSSSQNLSPMVQAGMMRAELFHRLNSVRIALPPLRERMEDILPLTEHFLKTFAPNRLILITPDTRRALTSYHWPGNVQELRTVLERAVLVMRDNIIQPNDLLVELAARETFATRVNTISPYEPVGVGMDHGLGQVSVPTEFAVSSSGGVVRLEEVERREILTALERTNWHQGRTAELLGISPSTLYRRLREYNITKRMMRAQRATR
jgi:DNA-binding NtrC family response regulator